jgi:hypothetical protein
MVLNIVALLALFNVIGHAVMGNLNNVLYFIVIAVLIRYFSKNMTIVLGIPLIIVNLFAIKGNVLEGMESGNNDSSNNIVKKEENKPQMVDNNSKTVSNDKQVDTKTMENTPSTSNEEKQGFEPGRRKNRGYNVDYATTIEDAYDELNNILGSDGIQRLTSDTQNLMKQQMQLAEAMKGMGPIIKSIEPMVQNLKGMMGQMGEGKEGLGGLMDLAKKMSGQSTVAAAN